MNAAATLPPAGLVWRPVASLEEVQAAMRDGSRNRATGATAMNAASSRSHAVMSVKLLVNHVDGRSGRSLIHLIDLAGSERVERSEVTGSALKEATAINKSLAALGDVIAALQRRASHVPYRNSKLTAVLQDALCGSSKVRCVFCFVWPRGV